MFYWEKNESFSLPDPNEHDILQISSLSHVNLQSSHTKHPAFIINQINANSNISGYEEENIFVWVK